MRINFLFILNFFICTIACKQESQQTLLGYKYDVLRSGSGKQAKDGDMAYFNIITVVGDSIVEDTHLYPFQPTLKLEIVPERPIASVVDALKSMKIGDSIRLHIPIDSLPFAKIEYQSYKEIMHLITLNNLKTSAEFDKDMEVRNKFLQAFADSLLSLDSAKKAILLQHVKDYNDKKLDAMLQTTSNNVKYLILHEGNGIKPAGSDMIEVNYVGALTNEFIFDASFPKGQPYVYRINTGQVIKGWDDALANFKEGTEAIIIVPAEMGYGATGSQPNIPPNAELVFYVNLFKVRPMKSRI